MAEPLRLTFASYNIHKGVGVDRRLDPDRIISVMRETRADVIALQEADRRFGTRAAILPRALLDDTPWRVVPVARRRQSMGWHGNAILARRDMDVAHSEALHLPTLEPRGAARADLTVEGRTFRVVGMHLDLSGLRRRDQIKAVLRHCRDCDGDPPTVLMGDFNQWGRTRGAMQEFGDGWTDLPAGASFPSRRPLAWLDRILVTDEWRCENVSVHHSALASVASDHLPVIARLELPA